LPAQADERGPCGDVASHFMGHLVFMGLSLLCHPDFFTAEIAESA
jgi:hypothetical protein